MNPLEILSDAQKPWMSQYEIALRTQMIRPELVPTVLKKLEERELVTSRTDDEGGRVYQITPAGMRHRAENETKRKISSFPPPRIP